MRDAVKEYCDGVASGKFYASELVKMACNRHLSDLKLSERESFPFRFDVEAAMRPIRFFSLLRQWEGKFSGKPLVLEPWQEFIVGSIFGWKRKKDGYRRYRNAYVEIPRKNGKSTLASGIALYMLAADGEEGAQIFSLATTRDQAKIVWTSASKIVKKSGLSDRIRQYYVGLEHERSNSKFEPLASEDSNLDGLNPHCVICDEVHQWPDRGLWDVIEDAFGARCQPLMFAITTAGNNRHGICYEQRTHASQILQSSRFRLEREDGYIDDAYFAYIATIDEDDEEHWKEERIWWKSNPNLGVSKDLDYMRDQVNKADLMPSKLVAVKNKQLNIWTDVSTAWLKMKRWDECSGEVDPERLVGKDCFGGMDLSSVGDVTAVVYVFPPSSIYSEFTILPFFYLPEEGLAERQKKDRVPYRLWADKGLITLTPGDLVDLDFIYRDIKLAADRFNIKEIGFDPWKAIEIATKLQNDGLTMVQMRQGHATLGAPTRELETKVLSRQLRHGGNPVLRWMASNTAVIRDSNDNIKPDKQKAIHRIDGIVATIMALGRAIVGVPEEKSVYEERGLRKL